MNVFVCGGGEGKGITPRPRINDDVLLPFGDAVVRETHDTTRLIIGRSVRYEKRVTADRRCVRSRPIDTREVETKPTSAFNCRVRSDRNVVKTAASKGA